MPEKINEDGSRKEESGRGLFQKTAVSRSSVLRLFHQNLIIFPYEIRVLQNQTPEKQAGKTGGFLEAKSMH